VGRLSNRYIAGPELGDAVETVRGLNDAGRKATLDVLGEEIETVEEALAIRAEYEEAMEAVESESLDANVSVKLTALGLKVDPELCAESVRSLARKAAEHKRFVRIDMEQSTYTAKTLQLFTDVFYPEFGTAVGVVLQSYLRRTVGDVDAMSALGARVRLCKGAYKEPEADAFPDKRDVDANFIACMEKLLTRGNYPGIATHDEKIIAHAKQFTKVNAIPPARFEFQMLYGVRRDLQSQLTAAGYRVRVYIPFGGEWFPYFMRRLGERPANVVFVARGIANERG